MSSTGMIGEFRMHMFPHAGIVWILLRLGEIREKSKKKHLSPPETALSFRRENNWERSQIRDSAQQCNTKMSEGGY